MALFVAERKPALRIQAWIHESFAFSTDLRLGDSVKYKQQSRPEGRGMLFSRGG
jgi:hypothetical protein